MNNVCEGIVLAHKEFKDNDMIIDVLTKEEGTLSFVAKGIKKATSKNASACELFCVSRFLYNENERNTLQLLKTAERVKTFRHIYDHLEKQVIASFLCEVANKIAKEESYHLYDLLYTSLLNLDRHSNHFGVLSFFMAKCNEVVGVNPNVDGCVHCQNQKVIAISIRDGGFVCADCFKEGLDVRLSIERLRLFRLFHRAQLEDYAILEGLQSYSFEDVKPIILMFLEYSGIHLRSMKLLQEIIALDK